MLAGRATIPHSTVAFRPFTEALFSYFRDQGPPEVPELEPFHGALTRLVPAWRRDQASAPDESVVVVAEAVLRLLRTVGQGNGCLLVLDDLQWADPETLSILEYLAENIASEPVVCVCTVRSGEDSGGLGLADALAARRAASMVTLARLAPAETTAMAQACLSTQQLPAPVDRLLAESTAAPRSRRAVRNRLVRLVRDGLTRGRAMPGSSAARGRRAAVRITVVLAALVGLAGPTRASAAPDPCAPDNQIVDTFVDQFGLTRQDARDRIRAECRASNLRPAAQQAAGAAFAGAYYEQSSRALVVAVTDSAVFDAVAVTGAEPRLVAASYADLEQDLHVLDSRVGTQPAEVTGWRIDEAANTVVVDVVGGPTRGVRTFVAGLDHVRVDYDQLPVSTTAEILGGMPIYTGNLRCSAGFSARNSAGTVYVLTAGHCTNLGSTWGNQNGTIGTVAGSFFPTNDFGRIQRTNTAFVPTSKILYGSTTVLGNAPAAIGTTVCRSGSTTGYKCGVIQAVNQTTCYSQGCVYQMIRTTACAEPGDSGGPLISSSRQAQGVLSGGNGNCFSGGTTFYQPVNEILSVFGLTLVTG